MSELDFSLSLNEHIAIQEDEDIESRSEQIYAVPRRILVRDTDNGVNMAKRIEDLQNLIQAYRSGVIQEAQTS